MATRLQRGVLVDADAIVSAVNKRDSGYQWAVEVKELMTQGRWVGYLTSYAYSEALTVISMRVGRKEAIRTAKTVERGVMVLVDVGRELRESGLRWFLRQTSKNVSFTDCVNMALMESLNIKEVFSRDLHYKKNGFVRLGIDE